MNAILLALSLVVQDAAEPTQTPPGAGEVPVEATQQVLEPAPVSDIALNLLSRVPASLEDWEPDGRDGAVALQVFSMVGREDLVQFYQPEAYSPPTCPVLEDRSLDDLYALAREAQIVIINEAHNQPLHRLYIAEVARGLSDEFDVYAAETFNYLRLIEPRGPGALGFYDREPVFHRSVETIEEEGYRLVAYEIRATQRDPNATTAVERIAVRENAQADNLIAEVFADDPDARIIVHVGYSHVLEAPIPMGEGEAPLEWFAVRLKQKTGIDPLTISQTHCRLEGVTDDEEGQESGPSDPFELALADPAGLVPDGALDFAVARPAMTFQQGRPAWRFNPLDRVVAVPDAFLPADQPVMVEVREIDEPLAAVPIERLLLYPGDTQPLFIPPGSWSLTAWSAEGGVAEPQVLIVE